jgi:hypothetical protein
MLGDSVLALPCFVYAAVGAKTLALDSTLPNPVGIGVPTCLQTAKCFGASVHTKRSELSLRCRTTTATLRVVSVWPTTLQEALQTAKILRILIMLCSRFHTAIV